MARFRFRLEASLRLAEQVLDKARRKMAEEMRKQQEIADLVERRRRRWELAVAGQREAGLHRPQELGGWQAYTVRQLGLLRASEAELAAQTARVEKARSAVVLAHQETEKFQRLKEKLLILFQRAEMKKEQAAIDEVGQVIYWHQRHDWVN